MCKRRLTMGFLQASGSGMPSGMPRSPLGNRSRIGQTRKIEQAFGMELVDDPSFGFLCHNRIPHRRTKAICKASVCKLPLTHARNDGDECLHGRAVGVLRGGACLPREYCNSCACWIGPRGSRSLETTDQRKIDAVLKMPYGPAKRDAWRRLNLEIGNNNREAIDRCDLVFAVFDGVDIDSGTAAEIGYAFAREKAILGYRGDFRLSADNDGSMVNLQVEDFIRA
jgi:Nucleoside 2-deoxyribosyltransferase